MSHWPSRHRRCRRCRVDLSFANVYLTPKEREIGMRLQDVVACDACRPNDDESYGIACSIAARRSQAVA